MGLRIIKAFHELFFFFFSGGFCPRAAVGVCVRDRDAPEGSGGPTSPLCPCPWSSGWAPSVPLRLQELREEENSPCSRSEVFGCQKGDGTGAGYGLETQIDDCCCFIPGKRRTHPTASRGSLGSKEGMMDVPGKGWSPKTWAVLAASLSWAGSGKSMGSGECSDGCIREPLPLLCLQSPARVAGARYGCGLSPNRE